MSGLDIKQSSNWVGPLLWELFLKEERNLFQRLGLKKRRGYLKKKENSTFDQDNMFKIEILLIDQLP